jgi:hypothetical protein
MQDSQVQQASLRPGAGSSAGELGNLWPQQGAPAPQASGPVSGSSALAPARVPLELSIRPRRILYGLLAVIALLILAATLGMIAWLGFGRPTIRGLRTLFDLASENNIPTYFSTLQLVIAAVLLGVIACHQVSIRAPWRWHFVLLALGFGYLSVDEAASLHEILMRPIGISVVGDLFYFKWLGPGIVVVALLGLSYLRFLLALPRRIGALFLVSGIVFVVGAVGAEWIGSEMSRDRPDANATWAYQIEVIVEEGLEMTGIALFIYALLVYIEEARIALVARVQS